MAHLVAESSDWSFAFDVNFNAFLTSWELNISWDDYVFSLIMVDGLGSAYIVVMKKQCGRNSGFLVFYWTMLPYYESPVFIAFSTYSADTSVERPVKVNALFLLICITGSFHFYGAFIIKN